MGIRALTTMDERALELAKAKFDWKPNYGVLVSQAARQRRRAIALGLGARDAGCSLAEAINLELINSASVAKAAGYSASEAKAAGYSAREAKAAGYSASEAMAARLINSASEARAAG